MEPDRPGRILALVIVALIQRGILNADWCLKNNVSLVVLDDEGGRDG